MKKKITIFILSILILIFIISIIVSLDRFGVWNPISTLCIPLNKYMNENGYEEIKEDEMAGNKIYTNRKSNILVEVSTNRYVYCCIIKE